MTWFDIDPEQHQRSPYDLTGDQMDLLVKDLQKAIPALEDGQVTPRRIVEEVLDLLEEWHG